MIILRQKIFTRAEKEALRQIYRKTGGLRNLPNGVTNLEDAKALKDLAIQLNSGSKTVNLTPEIRRALDNMGLTKITPELLNRVAQKYNNPELNNRFNSIRKTRIMNHIKNTGEMPEFQKSAVRVMENMKKDPIIPEEYITPASPDSKNIIRFLRKKTETIVVPSNNGSYSRLVNPNNIPEGLTQRQIKGIKSGKITRIIGLKENAPEEVILHEAGHNISRSTIPNSNDYRLNNSYKYYNPNTGDSLMDTAEKLVADKSASLIKGNGNYKNLVADIGNVAEENLASAYSLDKLKNSPNIALRKKNLDNALGTYVRDLKSEEMGRISFRPLV